MAVGIGNIVDDLEAERDIRKIEVSTGVTPRNGAEGMTLPNSPIKKEEDYWRISSNAIMVFVDDKQEG